MQGNLEKVFEPATVGLIFEGGRDLETDDIGDDTNLVISAEANGPYLGDFQQQFRRRMPIDRHPKGQMAVLYCDGHGGTIEIAKYDDEGIPLYYAPRVRVSPYEPN